MCKKKCVQLFNDRFSCKKAKNLSNARQIRKSKSFTSNESIAESSVDPETDASPFFKTKGLQSASKFGIILHRTWLVSTLDSE